MDLHSFIHPAALDLMLDSANNATQKGQSQYSTPVELAAELARDLPHFRPVLIDLTCGPGQLLDGSANKSTEHLLGLDVDPRREPPRSGLAPPPARTKLFIQADLTAVYEPMRQIDFRADCFVLNPPWSLNWHAQRLEGLAESEVPAVAKTFKALYARRASIPSPLRGEGRGEVSQSASIDSTLATLLIALDRLSRSGEGLLIGYTSTLERLIFAPDAPGQHLVPHIWKRRDLAPDGPGAVPMPLPEPLQQASAIYFSAAHEDGPTRDGKRSPFMPAVSPYSYRREVLLQWKALNEHVLSTRPEAPPQFHLSLRGQQIFVRLGLFDSALTQVNQELAKTAKRLHKLNGRNPLQVVMQRDERNFILGLIRSSPSPRSRGEGRGEVSDNSATHLWTVEPALKQAVQDAVNQYNAVRAPLVPLPKIQRLGYLDENDDILCVKDLPSPDGKSPLFHAGRHYKLSTRSMRFTRTQLKPNLRGEEEELELSGQELAIIIDAASEGRDGGRDGSPSRPSLPNGRLGEASLPEEIETDEYCFMDAAMRAGNVKVENSSGAEAIQFTTLDLIEHFDIPNVPAIASTDPDRYDAFVAQLHQLEQITNL